MFEEYYINYWKMLTKKVPKPIKLFIDLNWREKTNAKSLKIGKIWLDYLTNVDSILDYGGGNRMTGLMLENLGWSGTYDIVDMSENVNPEYKDLTEVKKTYDMIVCLQVIEHMYFEDFLKFIKDLTSKLKKGGVLVIGSDHPAHPGHLWNVEMGHVKAYPFYNLHQFIQMNNFDYSGSKIILQYIDHPKIIKYILYYIRKIIFSFLGLSPYLSYIIFIKKMK